MTVQSEISSILEIRHRIRSVFRGS